MSPPKSSPVATPKITRAVAYRRVSTTEQADSGAGLMAQQAIIDAEIARRGWQLVEVCTDTASGKSVAGREALAHAIELLESREADVLVVAKLDRLSRSLLDFALLLDRAQRNRWVLVALDLGIDLSTPAGEFLASVMASAATWERKIIGQRTRDALAAKAAAGVRLGRPRLVPDEVCERILDLRSTGLTWQQVAARLNADRVPTASGGAQWYPSTARHTVLSYERHRGAVS